MRLEKVFTNCDWCNENDEETLLVIPTAIEAQWWSWTRVNPSLELLALFSAEQADGLWYITKMWLPKQRVTSVECEILDSSEGANGMIHSHHRMSAKMSGQDRRDLMPSYKFSMVTNHDGESQAYERVELPCGGIGFREATLVWEGNDEAATDVRRAVVEPPKPVQQIPGFMPNTMGPRLVEVVGGGWPETPITPEPTAATADGTGTVLVAADAADVDDDAYDDAYKDAYDNAYGAAHDAEQEAGGWPLFGMIGGRRFWRG